MSVKKRQPHILEGRTINERQARCRRCRCWLVDCEPAGRNGEWWHKLKNTCPNADKTLGNDELVVHLTKRELRARNRGAKMASKRRSK